MKLISELQTRISTHELRVSATSGHRLRSSGSSPSHPSISHRWVSTLSMRQGRGCLTGRRRTQCQVACHPHLK